MGQFRFVHVGVAVALAAATVSIVGMVRDVAASGDGAASVFVPIVPCRLADTRAGSDNVGPRATPIGAAETLQLTVWGTNGNCTIPNTATGIATNVTAVGPTAASYLSVFPADANPRPTASNLNVTSTSPPTPNQVTVALSATGAIGVYNNGGQVDVIVDIVGYYIPATGTGGPQGPIGPQGPAGQQGPIGVQGPIGPSGVTPEGVIWVAKSGGQFTSVSAAMNSITDNNPHLIKVGPGTFVETSTITLKNNVDIEGSGQDRSIITCNCGAINNPGQRSTIYASGTIASEIRDITIINAGGQSDSSYTVELNGVNHLLSIVDATLKATSTNPDAVATNMFIVSSDLPHVDGINAFSFGVAYKTAIYLAGGRVVIRNSYIDAGTGTSVYNNGSVSWLISSTVLGHTGNMTGHCASVFDYTNAVYPCA